MAVRRGKIPPQVQNRKAKLGSDSHLAHEASGGTSTLWAFDDSRRRPLMFAGV